MVLNVHLEAFDQQTRESQAADILKVVDEYVNRYPIILMGDFNARPPYSTDKVTDESTISMFLEHPRLAAALDRNTYLAAESQHFTFDTAKPYEKLDYIFYTHSSIEPLEVATLNEAGEISDHFPLFMRFKLLDP
jgi:endonuclease/exonuclease/phosphatase family metal-dependent hydrolase